MFGNLSLSITDTTVLVLLSGVIRCRLPQLNMINIEMLNMTRYDSKRKLQQIEYAKTHFSLTFITSISPSAIRKIANDKVGKCYSKTLI